MIPGAKKMILVIAAISCAIMVVGAFFLKDKIGFILGVLIGSLASVLKVWLMSKSIHKSVAMEPSSARNYATLQYYFRYAVTGVILVVCALVPFINLWGAVLGVLTFSIAAYMAKFTVLK